MRNARSCGSACGLFGIKLVDCSLSWLRACRRQAGDCFPSPGWWLLPVGRLAIVSPDPSPPAPQNDCFPSPNWRRLHPPGRGFPPFPAPVQSETHRAEGDRQRAALLAAARNVPLRSSRLESSRLGFLPGRTVRNVPLPDCRLFAVASRARAHGLVRGRLFAVACSRSLVRGRLFAVASRAGAPLHGPPRKESESY